MVSPTSAGIMASCPYVRWKGVSPVGVRVVVLYAYRTLGNSSSHMPFAPYPLKLSLNHLEEGSVCDFNLPVGLGVSGRGVMVLDP